MDVQVAVDTSGPALREALAAGPALIKPNHHELEEAVRSPLSTIQDVIGAARQLCASGAKAVLASLGRDGAVLVEGDGVWHSETPVVQARSSVGAGDSMLAGFLAAGGKGERALVSGAAWGAAAVSLPGSTMPRPDDLRPQLVEVHPTIQTERELRGDN